MRQLAVGYDEPAAVHRQVARRARELRGQAQGFGDTGLAKLVGASGTSGAAARVQRAFERGGIGQARARHAARERVDVRQRHAEHLGRLAERGARPERGVRGDHGDAVVAIALVHMRDHFVAAAPAQVHVQVRAVASLRVQEALEA